MQSLQISTAALRGVQQALDTASNNIANLDTVGFKRRGASFSELLNDSMDSQPSTDKARTSPAGLRIGSGVKVGLTPLDMTQGSAKQTDVPTDLMIEGEGMFLVSRYKGMDAQGNVQEEYRLTRNGAFHLSMDNQGSNTVYNLVTASGDVLLDEKGLPIELPTDGEITVRPDGQVLHNGEELSAVKIPVFKLDNPDKFKQAGENEFLWQDPNGDSPWNVLNQSDATLRQGFLEMSNVDLNKEMSQVILAQRAYQLNSRAIEISDQMMGIANSIRSR
ncbi:flagellar hook-basal body protein [Brevibacillus fluminis]|uniref:flagellar hook-basal body protein n=1 Tax=Brevibacillus fluminis TaxID=511487 RepID=UPI003F8AC8F6